MAEDSFVSGNLMHTLWVRKSGEFVGFASPDALRSLLRSTRGRLTFTDTVEAGEEVRVADDFGRQNLLGVA